MIHQLIKDNFQGGKVLFDDKLFNGTSKEFNLTFDKYYDIEI